MTKIVIIGATGNVGTALIRRLADSGGSARVLGLCRRVPDSGTSLYDACEWHYCDLSSDIATPVLDNVLRDADVVVHAAWAIQPNRNPAYLHRVNVIGTEKIVRSMLLREVPHLVYLSSVGAYSPAPRGRRVDERWPTGGVPSSSYSRDKAAVEHLLDVVGREYPALHITRFRPGLIFQSGAASEISRYFIGPLLPPQLVGTLARKGLGVLPLPAEVALQVVHARDVAAAIVAAMERQPAGAFNLATEPPLGPDRLADLLGARHMPISARLARAVTTATWWAGLQPTEPGWVDLAGSAPLLATDRARRELGWQPTKDAAETLGELLHGMARGAGDQSPVLRPAR